MSQKRDVFCDTFEGCFPACPGAFHISALHTNLQHINTLLHQIRCKDTTNFLICKKKVLFCDANQKNNALNTKRL